MKKTPELENLKKAAFKANEMSLEQLEDFDLEQVMGAVSCPNLQSCPNLVCCTNRAG